MKKTLFILLIAGLFLSIIACNNSETSKNEKSDNNDETVQEEEHQASEEELNRITPADIDANTAIPVAKLSQSYYEWYGKEILIAGYVKMYLEDTELSAEIEIIGKPRSNNVLFNCKFTDTLTEIVKNNDIVTIKGIVDGNGYWGIKLIDCEYVGIDEDYQKGEEINPYRLPKKAIFAQDIYDLFSAWEGTEVSVIGYYASTTTSTTSYGTTIRIDLKDPESGETLVGCRMKDEPDSDYLKDNREDVVIRGIIGEESFGRIMIEECVIVK